MQAIVSNSLDYFFGSIADAIAFSKSPEVQILGVTADRRVKGLESIPTMAELGLPKINSKLWYAFMAPSQTPADRINRLFDAFAEVAKDPALQQQLSTFGFNVEVRDADALSQMMKEEAARWKRLIEVNNIAINE